MRRLTRGGYRFRPRIIGRGFVGPFWPYLLGLGIFSLGTPILSSYLYGSLYYRNYALGLGLNPYFYNAFYESYPSDFELVLEFMRRNRLDAKMLNEALNDYARQGGSIDENLEGFYNYFVDWSESRI